MRAAIGLLLLLVACGQGDEPGSRDETVKTVTDSDTPMPVESIGWTMLGIGEVAERIGYSNGTGGMAMELSCLSDPARLQVMLPVLPRIGSEERLTLGLGGRLVPLVATAEANDPVAAETPLSAELIAALSSAEEIGFSYGATQNDPVPAPPPALMYSFATACSAAMNAGAADAEREDL